MKIGTPRPRASATIDMVPMINFAFLLLIFVILVGAIAAPDALKVQPPRSLAQATLRPEPDTLVVDAEGQLAFEGERVAAEALLVRVQNWRADAGDRALIVKADAGVEAERLVVILEVLRAAGVARAQLLTLQRQPG